MKHLLFATILLAPGVALAQQPDQQAQQQGAQAAVMDQFQLLINKNTVIAVLQAQIADLQKQLADAKAKPQEPRP